MQLENPLTFVRSLKGAPASILWAFFFTRRVMTALELQEWTGYKGDNITVAVRLLVNLGWLIARSPRGPWCLADGRQFPLMDESDLIGFIPSVVVVDESNEKVPTIATITTTTRSTTPIKSDSSNFRSPEDWKALSAVLKEFKIIGKKREQLIACDWVNAEYVRAHVKYADDERIWDQPVGMAITRMLEQVDMPESETRPAVQEQWWEQRCEDCGEVRCICEHDDDCECNQCRRNFPDRFCKALYDAGRGNVRGVFTDCKALAVPGTRYCAAHQDPSMRGHFDQDGKERDE